MFKHAVKVSLSAAVLCWSALAGAQDMGPKEVVQQTSDQVIQVLSENKQAIADNPRKAAELVGDIVLPRFDFELMSRFVLARNWNTASESQREAFTEEFKQLLVRTYASSLTEYSGETVEVLPVQGDLEKGRVTVKTEIVRPDGPKIPIDYSMRKVSDGWKVYDVTVEGVSLVQNYRGSFATEVRNKGIDGLIEQLKERNARGGG